MKKLGLYIHIPFCIKKCLYCDFYSISGDGVSDEYLSALMRHLDEYKLQTSQYAVDTVFIGGGTPSLMSEKQMAEDTAFMAAFAERMANAVRCPVGRDIPDNVKEKLDIYLTRKRGPKH